MRELPAQEAISIAMSTRAMTEWKRGLFIQLDYVKIKLFYGKISVLFEG